MSPPELNERLAKIEQSYGEHLVRATEAFKENKEEHLALMHRLDELEVSLLIYRRVVYVGATMIGMAVGFLVKYWDFIVHRLGH